ncbi:pentapeptide repeat protein [Sphingomonas sp. PP-F2F-A104-K0414]|uniref:pentapeptide repeat-containing protein n=1 Tax=Sphingomonas sp. PP-F2F-A104-K0414 TaxID=2135661 RepID=UPI001049A1C4|nr:pentapeptide repeat-containing protein [Sphingomonas sp. PP-F2F-A104-K0414]TCP96358.1 pentapeptide repeat protein [Sphingomonas sp. PP-F2F-A104-K0414]
MKRQTDTGVMSESKITETLHQLLNADGAPFSELAAIAGLKPAVDFRRSDMSGVDFAGSDLTGFDFSAADLSGASFVGALIDGTRFWRARINDVAWPEGYTPSTHELGTAKTVLSKLQTEIVARLTHSLHLSDPGRALAMLPDGVGRTAILAAVLRNLWETSDLGSALILTEAIAEREQLADRLQDAGFQVRSGERAFDSGSPPRNGEFRVETFGNLHRHLQDMAKRSDPHVLNLGFSHVVLTSVPQRRRSDIAALAYQDEAPSMLAFTRPFYDKVDADGRLTDEKMRDIFSTPAVTCSFEDAMRSGVLQPAKVTAKRGVLNNAAASKRGDVDDTTSAMNEVAYDFVKELNDFAFDVPALIVIPEVEAVERLVNILDEVLHFVGSGDRRRTPIPISSRHRRGPQNLRHADAGTVFVMTPQMLDGFDVREAGLIGVMGKVPLRHVAKLAFTHADRPMRTIIDYTDDTFADAVASLAQLDLLSP